MVGEMTFAEAMADGPRLGLEVCDRNGNWIAFDTCGQYQPAFLARAKFRRARPKRSRVQEMSDRITDGLLPSANAFHCQGGLDAVRAVCEFLRSKYGPHQLSSTGYAEAIEREFLEPR